MTVTLKLERLKTYFEGRVAALGKGCFSGNRHAVTIEALIGDVLRLMERTLTELLGDHHFELSVWVDPKAPRILAYYDSGNNQRPRSDAAREGSPDYYRQRKYEVIGILDHPKPDIVYKERPTSADYYFVGEAQEAKIKSTFLYCFDPDQPAVIVATCDQPGSLSRQSVPAELIRTIGLAIRAELALWESVVSPMPVAAGTRGQPAPFVYSWIHVSDIHFGAGSKKHRFDQKKVCAALLRDVEKSVSIPGGSIIVTGDIAFSAEPGQYRDAAAWLLAVAGKAGVSAENIFLVPGNHDVDRKNAADPAVVPYHESARRKGTALDELLANEATRATLLKKLAAYQQFVVTNFPGHPRAVSDWCGDWRHETERMVDGRKLSIRLVGLSTVWVSDEWDGKSEGTFLPNMAIAQGQLDMLLHDARPDELVLLLSHHPPEWLLGSSRTMLEQALARLPHVHLCGHVHRKGAGAFQQFGRRQAMRFVAGAVHDEEQKQEGARSVYHGEHGYSVGAIRWQGRWEVGWGPRVYLPELDEMRIDHTRYNLDERGFAWEPLRPLI